MILYSIQYRVDSRKPIGFKITPAKLKIWCQEANQTYSHPKQHPIILQFGGKPLFLSSGAATARFLQKRGHFWRVLEIFGDFHLWQKPSFPYS